MVTPAARSLPVLLLLACSQVQPPTTPRPLTPLPPALAATGAGPAQGGRASWQYEVTVGPLAKELQVEAVFGPRPATGPAAAGAGTEAVEFTVDKEAAAFVREVEVAGSGSWRGALRTGAAWTAPCNARDGCRLRYRYLLAQAASSIDDVDEAMETRGTYLATPPAWLLRPAGWSDEDDAAPLRARLHVSVPPGLRFITGLYPAPGGAADTYEADTTDLDDAPYSGFGAFRTARATTEGGTVEVAIAPAPFASSDEELRAWAARSAGIVSGYFGGFPVPRLQLIVVPSRRGGIGLGTTLGHGGAAIVVYVGLGADATDLGDDWVLPHEMIHLGMSQLPRHQRWLTEGVATYVEPIADARAGRDTPEEVWGRFLDRMEQGLPGWGDRGLDHTATWGRVYWGGALFCLVADVEIRRRTGNRRALDDALRAIVRAGGNIAADWDLEPLLEAGDQGTGEHVLMEMYRQWADRPVKVDLSALWRRLGISLQGDTVRFDDHAELAAIRRSITGEDHSGSRR